MDNNEMRDFWRGFLTALENCGGVLAKKRALPDPGRTYIPFGVGRTGVKLVAVIDRTRDRIRTEIYLDSNRLGSEARELYEKLKCDRSILERELGFVLDMWDNPQTNYRIATHNDTSPAIRGNWPDQYEFLIDRLHKTHKAFGERVSNSGM